MIKLCRTFQNIKFHKFILITFLLVSKPSFSQGWEDCCRGYEQGYKNGYAYPELFKASTVVPAACNCTGIIGTLNYESGYAKGYEDGRQAKAKLNQPQQQRQVNKSTPYKTNPYIDPNPYGYNTRSSTGNTLFSSFFLACFKFFPEWGFGVNNHITSDKPFNLAGGVFSLRHDFGRRFRMGVEYSSYANPKLAGVGLGLDYNFNKRRPTSLRANVTRSVLNPTLGTVVYITDQKNLTSYCGSLGLDCWLEDRNGFRLGLEFKYILGTQNTNIAQLSLLIKFMDINNL